MQNFINHLRNQIDLTDEQIEIILNYITVKKLTRGEMILNAGEFSDDYFFVESGVIRSYIIDDNGKEHIVQFGTENWIVSDRNSAMCKQEAKFYIQAIEESTVVILNDGVNDLITSLNPDYTKKQVPLLQNHIRHMQDRITSLLSAPAKTRYQDFIKLYPTITAKVPQWMIASYLGITPESLSRVRKDIASNG
ncbi:Crp/Fnr family transcriptional regulator [Faecalibacter bovis]|uniref:Crp/Fnr family transcriptional regulator n=1 Tax=Faecalibacter bovis TaxID=2898187 RepID=A0ABX7XBQ7_9FLAO|nr:Crp/Fnr family transcriptional regulator [Faecalibacter bovis]QTV05303.1 Crp/Fnr family transcriptional regulator [Faecalibacter bovis]